MALEVTFEADWSWEKVDWSWEKVDWGWSKLNFYFFDLKSKILKCFPRNVELSFEGSDDLDINLLVIWTPFPAEQQQQHRCDNSTDNNTTTITTTVYW